MEVFVLVIILFVAPGEGAVVKADFDTLNDCETASAIVSVMPGIVSTECFTVTDEKAGDPVDYQIEQGV